MQSGSNVKELIIKAIEEYNKYRSPEANAKLLSINDAVFEVEFTGTFCYTCGVYEYFEDLKYQLKEFGVDSEIVEISELNEGAIVKFRLER